MSKKKTYSELITISSFEERFRYLQSRERVGQDTFGFDRYLNQQFYRSSEWKRVRDQVIIRDNACDLGVEGHEITGRIYIHHMNPITIKDIEEASDNLLNPEFLICVSFDTHNAIHFGDEKLIDKNKIITRTKNDTCPWKK